MPIEVSVNNFLTWMSYYCYELSLGLGLIAEESESKNRHSPTISKPWHWISINTDFFLLRFFGKMIYFHEEDENKDLRETSLK